jgi:RNA polymerase sigma-70 factor (ECF subfamily)
LLQSGQLGDQAPYALGGILLLQLSTLQQTIIRMKDIEGYELAEIAEITATPVENVRVNLSRARKKIREQFLQLNKQEKWT